MESIGKEIREIIKKRKLSFYKVAKDLGLAQESLYRSLLDNGNPRWKTIKRVLDYLDCDIRIVRRRSKENVRVKSK